MRITIFGGSQPKPGEAAYTQAFQLGRMLGAAGHTVLTGGYIGTMEAVSRGAAEAGGHVIGVTCAEIEAWRPVRPNAWVQEEMRYPTIRQRLFALIELCDAALALPGGVGTLTEVSAMWTHLLSGAIAPRPLILIGAEWQSLITQFYEAFGAYIPQVQRRWLSFAPDVEDAVQKLSISIETLL
jgi:uncharacterized protein (TIGR00730 family)